MPEGCELPPEPGYTPLYISGTWNAVESTILILLKCSSYMVGIFEFVSVTLFKSLVNISFKNFTAFSFKRWSNAWLLTVVFVFELRLALIVTSVSFDTSNCENAHK